MATGSPGWLHTTVSAVRELMVKRLEKPLDAETERAVQMALEELDVMWEEMEGQARILRHQNLRYSEFFDHAPEAYVVTDAGGNVREVNRAAGELLRAARDDIVGHPISEIVCADDRVAFLSRFIRMSLGPPCGTQSWLARLQPADGEPVMAQFAVRAIPLHKSGVGGLCWVIRPQR